MTLPTRTITIGPRTDPTTAKPSSGTLAFVLNAVVTATVSHGALDQTQAVARLDSTGSASVSLVPNDVAELLPANTTYTVTESITGAPSRSYSITLPSGSGPIALESLTPADPVAAPTYSVPVTGGTMTGPLILSGDPTASLQAATKEYVDNNSGGGGGGTPSSTVTDGTSFGVTKTAGTASAYSRGDHAHGTPSAPTASSVGADVAGAAATALAAAQAYADTNKVAKSTSLDQLTGPGANVAMAGHKITGLANGSASSDSAAFGQIPTALPPNGSASGDLSGTYPGPTVAGVNGVVISGTAAAQQVPIASGSSAASWAPLATVATLNVDGSAISSTTLANVAGLGIAVPVGNSEFEFVIPYTGSISGATGSAPNVNLTGPASSFVSYVIEIQTGVSTFNEYFHNTLNSSSVPGSGVGNTTVTYMIRIRGRITATAAGTLQPQVAMGGGSFTGSITLKAGQYGKVQPF